MCDWFSLGRGQGRVAGGTSRERGGKNQSWGAAAAPLGEDRFRSFLGFFSFFVVSPSNYKMLPPSGNSV